MKASINVDCGRHTYQLYRYDVTIPGEQLSWQHATLDKICGQMPKVIKENLFGGLPKKAKTELQEGRNEAQMDSLSIDVSSPTYLHTGTEALLTGCSSMQELHYVGTTRYSSPSQSRNCKQDRWWSRRALSWVWNSRRFTTQKNSFRNSDQNAFRDARRSS